MGFPRRLRVLLDADETGAPKEIVLGHRALVAAAVAIAVVLALLVLMLLGYGDALVHARRASRLADRLEHAEAEAARTRELRRELEELRGLQERLLAMLGVDQDDVAAPGAAGDTAGGASGALLGQAPAVITPRPSRWPVTGYVTREFAAAGRLEDHRGIDVAQPAQTPILAAGDGTVARAGSDPFLGSFLEIQHGLGYLTVYGHCSRVVVRPGARVRAGQVVAYTGATGQAAAPHLHFEVWRDGEPIDPREVLRGDPEAT